MPARATADTQVSTYVPFPLLERIDAAAEADGLSRSSWIRSTLVRELVQRSRREQGFPPTVEDPAVLTQLAAYLRGGGHD